MERPRMKVIRHFVLHHDLHAAMPIPGPLARLGRFVRSIFAPTVAIFSFSCLLTFIFVLYQPHPGPGAIQRLGWQSWDVVSDTAVPAGAASAPAGGGSEDLEVPSVGQPQEGVDWWNVSSPDAADTFDPASLPLDVWDPLMPHDTGCESPSSLLRVRLPTAVYHSLRNRCHAVLLRPVVHAVLCA